MQFRVQYGSGAGNAPRWLGGWPGRILAGVAGALLLIGFILFFTVFLAVGALFLIGVMVRWWWAMRKLRREAANRADEDVVDVEHRVVDVEVIEASSDRD
jgi:predicted lipid-binding transport protein (Tim44 family)